MITSCCCWRARKFTTPVRALFLLGPGQRIVGAFEDAQELNAVAAKRLWAGWDWQPHKPGQMMPRLLSE